MCQQPSVSLICIITNRAQIRSNDFVDIGHSSNSDWRVRVFPSPRIFPQTMLAANSFGRLPNQPVGFSTEVGNAVGISLNTSLDSRDHSFGNGECQTTVFSPSRNDIRFPFGDQTNRQFNQHPIPVWPPREADVFIGGAPYFLPPHANSPGFGAYLDRHSHSLPNFTYYSAESLLQTTGKCRLGRNYFSDKIRMVIRKYNVQKVNSGNFDRATDEMLIWCPTLNMNMGIAAIKKAIKKSVFNCRNKRKTRDQKAMGTYKKGQYKRGGERSQTASDVNGSSGQEPADASAGSSGQEPADASAGSSGQEPADASAGSSGQEPADASAGSSGQEPADASAGSSGQDPADASAGSTEQPPADVSAVSSGQPPADVRAGSSGQTPADVSAGSSGQDPADASAGSSGQDSADASAGSSGQDHADASAVSSRQEPADASAGSSGQDPADASAGSSGQDSADASAGSSGQDSADASAGSSGQDPDKIQSGQQVELQIGSVHVADGVVLRDPYPGK
ncbi:uncharacterized protein LOC144872259 [Branchiostoma floridae x Branchiostoma japonicum]